ncbi:hypothetical protein BZL30_4700 [Mycobacterium kansasii]|uniref:Uncharacterized protein n=1 Tax=Mycobacterium kansasii TaxID=1768 RepID=A0A1V3X4C3_MYCKA|nr:hypothetical protein BZL30_4700 [Mycobacterium kansasii]
MRAAQAHRAAGLPLAVMSQNRSQPLHRHFLAMRNLSHARR